MAENFVKQIDGIYDIGTNVYNSIFEQYERVIMQSLITSFGLDFLVRDQHGGDVDTIHNVRQIGKDEQMKYKNKRNEKAYNNRGKYNRDDFEKYHSNYKTTYREIENAPLEDEYTGKTIHFYAPSDDIQASLDHIISAKEVHDDRGRVLSGLDSVSLADSPENFAWTNNSLNKSMQYDSAEEYIAKHPELDEQTKQNILEIPKFEGEEIKKASVGASILIGGLGGAALGTAGGFAASGATTAAVMALGTASTGTAISALSGAAATNATLAALGGGSLAAGGGGIALGTTMLGVATLGVGLLVGGVIFSCTGSKLSSKADKAWEQMISNEQKINKICNYLFDLQRTAERYNATLLRMRSLYIKQLDKMRVVIESYPERCVNWKNLSWEEQRIIENTVLIVGVLYAMCKVQLVYKSNYSDQNLINHAVINKAEQDANDVMAQVAA